MFARVHRNLCTCGSLNNNKPDTGRRRLRRTLSIEKRFLQSLEDSPNTSTRVIVQKLGVSQSVVWLILHEHGEHRYHLQRVQLLQSNDYPHNA
ncbi:hypothetical protein TNIN_225761 [Trichonephila inaurata madagascariensis]|uniref:Transposase n=1 Tax=Trichonephila inaurata madagascariensis TaxID=2747483 RepID=A0A8X6YDR0_9ARAC|nr:hypothetical protein TNIN_225761 [Trichonephila inaurata madagascariensis]